MNPENPINIICLESEAFYVLIDKVIDQIKDKENVKNDKWIEEHEAMKMLRITSKTTLQKYRDERRIRFSQPSRKVIVYDRDSINKYLEKNAKTPRS